MNTNRDSGDECACPSCRVEDIRPADSLKAVIADALIILPIVLEEREELNQEEDEVLRDLINRMKSLSTSSETGQP